LFCACPPSQITSGENSAPAIVQSSLPGPAGNGTARPYAQRGKTLTWLSYGSRLRENECIAWVELLVGHQNVVNIIWIGWSADSIPQNLEDVLDPLGIIYVHIRKVIPACRAAALKRKLQVPIAIQSFEALRDRVAGNGFVQSRRNAVEQRRVLDLFHQGRIDSDEQAVLFHANHAVVVIHAGGAIAQRSRR